MLRLSGVGKRYGRATVVDGLDLQVERGECFGLLGPNGAGKSTTIRMILGLTHPDAGQIIVGENAVPIHARRARTHVGVVPQFDNLDPDFTPYENLLVYGRYFGLSSRELARRIPALLAFAGLEEKRNARIQTLSGGMKRRLTLARALINDPDVLLLDEPTTGLDPQARHVIWSRLKQLVVQGKAILLTTHFMDEAERLCDRIAVMDRGSIIASGTPAQLVVQTVEAEVVEVSGEDVSRWVGRVGARVSNRVESNGDIAYCYAHDATDLLYALSFEKSLRYLHRRANLEDVFLKLTGRDLRD